MPQIPNVNASLIREARMIVQQIFRHKENLSFWDSRSSSNKQAPSTPVWTLKCRYCLQQGVKAPFDAITIVNGNAICHTHTEVIPA